MCKLITDTTVPREPYLQTCGRTGVCPTLLSFNWENYKVTEAECARPRSEVVESRSLSETLSAAAENHIVCRDAFSDLRFLVTPHSDPSAMIDAGCRVRAAADVCVAANTVYVAAADAYAAADAHLTSLQDEVKKAQKAEEAMRKKMMP